MPAYNLTVQIVGMLLLLFFSVTSLLTKLLKIRHYVCYGRILAVLEHKLFNEFKEFYYEKSYGIVYSVINVRRPR
jgi:hypothetical protein